eukprot:792239_1
MSQKKNVEAMLISMGMEKTYIARAFNVYAKNYGHSYNAEVMTEIIIRLKAKDEAKKQNSANKYAKDMAKTQKRTQPSANKNAKNNVKYNTNGDILKYKKVEPSAPTYKDELAIYNNKRNASMTEGGLKSSTNKGGMKYKPETPSAPISNNMNDEKSCNNISTKSKLVCEGYMYKEGKLFKT